MFLSTKATMRKIIIFTLYCALTLNIQAQKAHQDNQSKKWGYEQPTKKAGWWIYADKRGYSVLDETDNSLSNAICWMISPQYDRVAKNFTERLAAVVLDGKVGYIDMKNRFVIEPKFDNIEDLHNFNLGLAAVKMNGKYGFINKQGTFVIEPQFEYAESFRDNLLATIKQDGKFGAINLKGEIVVPCKYILEEAMINVPISNKAYRNQQKEEENAKSNGEYDKLLEEIETVAKIVNKQIENDEIIFTDHSIEIVSEGGKVGLKSNNRKVLPIEYDELNQIEDGIFIACKGNHWGAVDIYGRTIIPCDYKWVFYDAPARTFVVNGKTAMGLYNQQGKMLLPDRLDYIGTFVDGKAPIWGNSVMGFVDKQGIISDGFAEDIIKRIDQDIPKETKGLWELYCLYTDLMPGHAGLHHKLGKALTGTSLHDKGLEHLKIASELEPNNTEFKETLKEAKKSKKNKEDNTNNTTLIDTTGSDTSIGLGVEMNEMDALGGNTGTEITGGGKRCEFLKYVLDDLEKKITLNKGQLQDEYYQQIKTGFIQQANKEGCDI